MTAPRVRVGQVGLGWFGRIHASAWLAVPEVELVGVCDRDESLLRGGTHDAAQSSFHVDAADDALILPDSVARYSDVEDLLASDIDVLDVVVDETGHAELVRRGLEAGLHVVVEKPVALSAAEVRELVALARRRDRQLYAGQVLRFDTRNVTIGDRLRGASLRHLSLQRNFQRSAHAVYGRIHPVFGAMVHDIDLAHWYVGRRPDAVTAFASSFLGQPTPDVLDVVLHWDDGIRAVLQNSWHLAPSCPYGFEFECKVQTDTATFVVRNEPDVQIWDADSVTSPEMHFWPSNHGRRTGALRAELEHFARCAAAGIPSDRVPLEQVMWTAEVADAVIAASARPDAGPVKL